MSDRWLEQCMNFKFMHTEAKAQVKLCRYGQEMKHHSIQWKTLHHRDQERHMPWHQVQTVFCFFNHKGVCSFWVSWTGSKHEPALLLENTGMVVAWCCSSEKTWTSAWCLHLASWQFIYPWHAYVWEFLAKKLILKSDRLSYSPDFPLCYFWVFPNWKPLWSVTDFQTFPICKYMWQPFWRELQNRGFSTVLKSENTD